MGTQAYDVVVRRIATGCDYHMHLFAKDAEAATASATNRARFAIHMTRIRMATLEACGVAVFRVVSCEVSPNQTRPIA
jgi:hypothetical protein